MARTTLGKLALLFAMIGALALAGCGGSDSYSISADDQARIDKLTADLADANKNVADQKKAADDLAAAKDMADTDLAAARDALAAAQATVDDLTMQIGMEPDDDDPNGSGLQGDLAVANAALDEAKTAVTTLTTQIGEYPTADNNNIGSGLKGQVAAAQAAHDQAVMDAEDLRADLGSFPDADGMGGSGIRGQLKQAQDDLAAARDEVTRLTTQIGDADTEGSLEQRLAAANSNVETLETKIGSMDDAADADGSLYAMLNHYMTELEDAEGNATTKGDEVETLKAMIGSMDDDADADGSLHAMLNHYMAMIGGMDDDASMADDASLYARINHYMAMIGSMDDEADAEGSLYAMLNHYMAMIGMEDDPDTDADEADGLKGDLAAKQAEVNDLKMKLMAANQRIQSLQQQQTAQNRIAVGNAIQTAIAGNRVVADATTRQIPAATPAVSITSQLPFAVASAPCTPAVGDPCSNHDVMVATGNITLAPATGAAFAGGTTTTSGSNWADARMTRSVMLPTLGTQTARVYVDTPGKTNLRNYVYFGWWEHIPVVTTNVHQVEGFAGGTNPVPGASATAGVNIGATGNLDIAVTGNLIGSATYTGIAAGKYAARVTTAGAVTNMDVGDFTAVATLNANFGSGVADTLPAGITGVVMSGAINGFMLNDGVRAPRSMPWAVTLNQDANGFADAAAAPTSILSGTTGMTIGGGSVTSRVAGNWQGQFYEARQSTLTGNPLIPPQAFAGTFDAVDTGGQVSVSGAFGTHTSP